MDNSNKRVFDYLGTSGAEVFIVGDFNAWQKTPMEEVVVDETNGISNYHCTLRLMPGRHQYKFVVNGEYITDPVNPLTVSNAMGTKNSVIEVKAATAPSAGDYSEKTTNSSSMENIMMGNNLKKSNGGGKSAWDASGNKGTDIRPVSEITCPMDKAMKKRIDEGVIEHFKSLIEERCQEVKALLKTIEEYNTVTNGIIEMEDDVLYSSAINAVMPTKLPKAISLNPSGDGNTTPSKLSFEGYLDFGAQNRFHGVVPSFKEFKTLLEIPNTPLDDMNGFLLCTEYSGDGALFAGYYQNELPTEGEVFETLLDKILDNKDIHRVPNKNQKEPDISPLLDIAPEKLYDKATICAALEKIGVVDSLFSRVVAELVKNPVLAKIGMGDSLCRALPSIAFLAEIIELVTKLKKKEIPKQTLQTFLTSSNYYKAIAHVVGKGSVIRKYYEYSYIDYSSYYCYQFEDFQNKGAGYTRHGNSFYRFPIYRFQNGRIDRAISKGYELFSVWSIYNLQPKYLYDRKQHEAMSGKIDKSIAQQWLKEFAKIRQWFKEEPELFDVNSEAFLNPEACLKKFESGATVLGLNRSKMNLEVIRGDSHICDEVIHDFAIERLLTCDLTRSNIRPAYERPCLTDQARGHWDLWKENAKEDWEHSVTVSCDVMARNPALDIKWDGVIGIDFGTKSTTVVCMTDRENPYPLPIGSRDRSKLDNSANNFYENPTIMQFRDYKTFMEDYARKAGRPPTVWDDLTVSHESEQTLSSCDNGPLYASFLNELKQWAGGKQTLRVKDAKGEAFDLKPYLQLSSTDIDPIELYAYEIGLQINNMKNGIFMRYELSYPVKYDLAVRERLRVSFERGIKKSLPASILNDADLMAKFKVRMRISEPAAYALCALQELNLVPEEGAPEVFYSVFDFGGGTTDFDYGICREGTEDEQDAGYYTVIEHFEPQGDKFLGGENLLQLMAYEVFKQNKELLMNGGSAAKGSGDDKKKEKKPPITFCKPFEDFNTYFTGSEVLVSNSSEARLNMRTVMNALRPLWEESNNAEAAAKIGNTLSVMLLNNNANAVTNVELAIDPEKLKKLLRERIDKGVSQFIVQLRNALRTHKASVNKIYILLAGNSSKSPLVTQAFQEHIEALKADYKTKKGEETSFKFILKPPLGYKPPVTQTENTPDKKAQPVKAAKTFVDMQRPTGKTGVAFGLVYSRDGGNVKIVDQNLDESGEISFRFFVGKANRRQQFEAMLSRETKVKEWVKVMGVADRETVELKYTEEPAATTGLLPVAKTNTIPINVSQPDEKDFKLFVRIASATSIEYVLAKDEASIDAKKINARSLD